MFASFKRSPASTPGNGNGNGTTGTEKDSSGDYADLEKRADGRWSVQNRLGTLKVAVDMDTNGKTTEWETRSGFRPARAGVLFFTLFTLMISGVLVGVTGVNIARNGGSMRHVDFLVGATSLSLWAFLFVTCMLGLYAIWRNRLKLFTAFWLAFICHWVLNLASTITFLVVAYQRDVIHPSNEVCSQHGLEPGCTIPVDPMLVLLTAGLCSFKLIAAYALYVMYKYRLTLLSRSQSPSATQTLSSPKPLSPSTPARPSFKPRFKAFSKSARQGRPWPPRNIPTIKIDLASDQSSASSYSNGSSGTGSAGFAVFEFATKYPSLRTQPLEPIGENLKAALEREREREKDEDEDEDEDEERGDA